MEKRINEALGHLRAHAKRSKEIRRPTADSFADGVNHAISVIETALEAELTEKEAFGARYPETRIESGLCPDIDIKED